MNASRGKVVVCVQLYGTIRAGTSVGGGGGALNLKTLDPLLTRAFAIPSEAVALQINCPGGSPAQTNLVYSRIRQLADEHKRPVWSFVEDVAASGGFYLACAG